MKDQLHIYREFDEHLSRHLSNELSKQERELFDTAMDTAEKKKYIKNMEFLWQKCSDVAQKEAIDVDLAWQRFKDQSKFDEVNTTGIKFMVIKYAAIFIAVFASITLLYYIFNSESYQRISTTENELKIIDLPDGSKVTLNSNSQLKYPERFSNNIRKISFSGEAFFNIQKNKHSAFIIDLEDAKIEVLGTSFNVKTHTLNDKVEVIVNSGKVKFSGKAGVKQNLILSKGEKGVYSKKQGQLNKKQNDDINYLAWKTKKMVFEEQTLLQIVQKLNTVYNANIIILDKDISQCKLSVTFDNQKLDSILEVLKSTLQINIIKNQNKIELTGEGC